MARPKSKSKKSRRWEQLRYGVLLVAVVALLIRIGTLPRLPQPGVINRGTNTEPVASPIPPTTSGPPTTPSPSPLTLPPGQVTEPQPVELPPPASPGSTPATNVPASNAFPRLPTSTDGVLRTLPSDFSPRQATNFLEMQIALARQRLSPGSIDGVLGSQTRAALRALQLREGLPITGEWDDRTRARLILTHEPVHKYQLTTDDLERLSPVPSTWLGKSKQTRLEYESPLELVAERSQSHPRLIQQLNPAIVWTNVPPGTRVTVPWIEDHASPAKASFVRIRLNARQLQAYDAQANLLAHFPCSIAHKVEKRPLGELRVAVIVDGPNYRFDPDLYSDVPEARRISRPLMIPPGPNNPVGTVWLGLNRAGYGIHGTPRPEEVGRTESRGCFRLANWNAELLLKMAWIGLPVNVEP